MVDYVGRQFGNYRLTRLLGKGSFAQVYMGEHLYLGTFSAIKILNQQLTNNAVDWFRAEARTIARLVHPNIVRVLEFGVEDATPFLVLDYAPNGTLRQRYPRGKPVPMSSILPSVRQVAEALQCAHDEQFVHRDVKPENMLVGRRDEVLLSDFGVALMAQGSLTDNVQNVAGTIAYIAPEQIQGRPRPASDQYSLGIVVYEWLCGERPFHGSLSETVSQHLSVPPPSLRSKVKTVSPAVEEVVMTALMKEPKKRFESIRAFAAALEQASQEGIQHYPSVQPVVDAATRPATAQPVVIAVGETPPATPVVLPVPPTLPMQQDARDAVGTVLCRYREHLNAVCSFSWSPDGTRIISVSNDVMVHVWDATTGKNLQLYQDYSDAVRVVAWSSDGSRIATAGGDALVRVWEYATNRLVVTYRGHLGDAINALAWSPRQHLLASSGNNGTVHVWDSTTGQPLTLYHGHTGRVNALAWSRDEPSPTSASSERTERLVSGGDDASVQIWEAFSARTIATYRGQTASIRSVAWSPKLPSSALTQNELADGSDTSRIACGREDGLVQMWNTATDREVVRYRYSASVSGVAWSPDGRRFAYASVDNSVQVWDTSTNRRIFTFTHSAPVRVMAWSPDGKYIASGGDDMMIQVWVASEPTPALS